MAGRQSGERRLIRSSGANTATSNGSLRAKTRRIDPCGHTFGLVFAALCSECRYEVSDLFAGEITYGNREGVDRVLAYEADRLAILEVEFQWDSGERKLPRAVHTISDPMSQTLWPCPRCGVLSLKFSERGVWRSD
jgi:hypothetical protein